MSGYTLPGKNQDGKIKRWGSTKRTMQPGCCDVLFPLFVPSGEALLQRSRNATKSFSAKTSLGRETAGLERMHPSDLCTKFTWFIHIDPISQNRQPWFFKVLHSYWLLSLLSDVTPQPMKPEGPRTHFVTFGYRGLCLQGGSEIGFRMFSDERMKRLDLVRFPTPKVHPLRAQGNEPMTGHSKSKFAKFQVMKSQRQRICRWQGILKPEKAFGIMQFSFFWCLDVDTPWVPRLLHVEMPSVEPRQITHGNSMGERHATVGYVAPISTTGCLGSKTWKTLKIIERLKRSWNWMWRKALRIHLP